MEPATNPSPRRFRPAPIILALMLGIPLLMCGGLCYLFIYEIRPHYDSVIWYYEDFQIVGGTSAADALYAEGAPPHNILVEAIHSRFIAPNNTVIETDGRRVVLSTVTWDSAIAMAPKPPRPSDNGEQMVEILDLHGEGTSHLSILFEGQRFKSINAWGHVRVHNTTNDQSVDLHAKWSDVEKVFGKPKRKEKKRVYHNKWV